MMWILPWQIVGWFRAWGGGGVLAGQDNDGLFGIFGCFYGAQNEQARYCRR